MRSFAQVWHRLLGTVGKGVLPYLAAASVVAACTVICWIAYGPSSQLADVAMALLLGVTIVSMQLDRGPSLFAAVLSALSFDFFFIPPSFSLQIDDLRHAIAFGVMVFVAFVVSQLTTRVRSQALERTRLAGEARDARVRVEAEQLRNALLSSISHDFRTPLGVVVGATSALLEADGPRDEGARRRLLETAHSEALRLNRQLVNVLQMTRLEAGPLPLRSEPQSVEEVVGAALNRLEDQLQGRDVAIEMPEHLPLVPFDSVLIEQVLVNLLENATKYSDPGTPVRIAARPGPAWIELEVADRGPGVAPEDADRVFEKYHRGHEREGGGFGLGLAICRGIVSSHGGRTWVEGREGGGASFRFTLPFEAPRERPAKGAAPGVSE